MIAYVQPLGRTAALPRRELCLRVLQQRPLNL
jgi:hypothetical protein